MDDTILIKERWNDLLIAQPGVRIRSAASILGVSELELLLTKLGSEVTLLRSEFQEILREASKLGYIMALTRNEECVIERKGIYANGILDKMLVGVFIGEEIDLRIFFNHWAYGFAFSEPLPDGTRYSLHFFSKDGEAMHKIFLNKKSNAENFHLLVDKFKSASQQWVELIASKPPQEAEVSDALIDVEGFRHEWVSLRDTHEFSPLIHKYNLSRTQALRLAPVGGYAVRVEESTLRNILNDVLRTKLPIMIFVSNKGTLQIFTGQIHSLVDHNEWLNVLDPEFNLHLKEGSIDQCWIVRKPTLDGFVTSIECFNIHGEQILQVFGKRKPGIEELQEWRALVEVYG